MNAIWRLIRFILGIVLFGCVVWGVVVLIGGGNMEEVNAWLIPTCVLYFMFDVVIRLADLEKWVKDDENGEHLDNWNCVVTIHEKRSPNPPKVETEEGKETT